MNGLLSGEDGGILRKIQKRMLLRLRKKLRNRTLMIRYTLGGRELLLPLQHDLPLIRKAYPQYSTNVGRISSYIGRKYPHFQMIDIGANVGDTAAIVREQSSCPILCIEGNDFYFGLLQENLRRGQYRSVEAVRALIATYTGELKGQIVPSSGSGHFIEDVKSSVQVSRLSDVLESYPDFREPCFLKIDTDGFDCSILRSELEWLGLRRPAIFFEYDPFFFQNHPYDGTKIFRDLSQVGYRYGIFYDNFGDYLLSLDLQQDRSILEELQTYYLGRHGLSYMDVLLLHDQDRDLAAEIRKDETHWSIRSRSKS